MGQLLKQSTAVNITVLLVDSADHITGKTGLTLTIYASKAAGTPAVITPTVTELDSTHTPGLYKLALTTGHTDTLGELQLHVTSSGADPTDVAHQVVLDLPGIAQTGDNYARIGAPAGASVSADIAAAKVDTAAIKTKTDSLAFTSAGKVDANTLAVSGTAQTARDLGASVLLSSGTGTGQVSLAAGKVSLVAADIATIEGGAWDVAIAGHLTSGTTGAALNAAGSAGDPWATLIPGAYGAGTAGNLVGNDLPNIAAIKAKTDNLPASPAAVSDVPTANANADALLDRTAGVETSRTLRQSMRLMLAALTGKLSGAATTNVVIRDTNDTKNRISATVDADGNRTAVTYDAS